MNSLSLQSFSRPLPIKPFIGICAMLGVARGFNQPILSALEVNKTAHSELGQVHNHLSSSVRTVPKNGIDWKKLGATLQLSQTPPTSTALRSSASSPQEQCSNDELSNDPAFDPKQKIRAIVESSRSDFDSALLLKNIGQIPSPFGNNQKLSDEYKSSAGVWEGYTLGEHTAMVLRQFERYFSDEAIPPDTTRATMRLILSLHDIGKAEAVRVEDKGLQHQYTVKVMHTLGDQLPWSQEDYKLALGMVDGDPLGKLLLAEISLSESIEQIRRMAKTAGMSPEQFLPILCLYYQSDVSSYTADAGGIPSLEYVFTQNDSNTGFQLQDDGRRLVFNSANEQLYRQLEAELGL